MHLWVITTYVSLLALLLNLLASPEGHSAPNAAAGRASGSSSSSLTSLEKSTSRKRPNPDKQSPPAAKPKSAKVGSSQKSPWVTYGRRCYHMRFQMMHILSPGNHDQFHEQTCKNTCIDSMTSYVTLMKDIGKHWPYQSSKNCIQSGFCARSRTINITHPICPLRQAAALMGVPCDLDACLCNMIVDVWRVKRHGPATDEFFKLVEAGWRNPLCRPSKVYETFEKYDTKWKVQRQTLIIVNKDVDCKSPSQAEQERECNCKIESDKLCHAVTTGETSSCAVNNPGPDKRCRCAPNQVYDAGQCSVADPSSSEAADIGDTRQDPLWQDIYNQLQDELEVDFD
ncbi:hypothetical protein BCR37DRAFT_386279 [Protomyces lactucae-debilis]|uniref:Extracellular membrane protein CFEM domain-containing protein n=1 Tax=Protomyces lactucae-debilis TaxID=2754530 RepID=A0A1Y2FLR3_PROLT|nr:uncharacterized protein BCR37DRAFT_386279 [Protomyces lactucae-debilis]ORY84932.1 hypothetical protein BCR37DRAFT_386279 [Protomyces lactucae-debilis]